MHAELARRSFLRIDVPTNLDDDFICLVSPNAPGTLIPKPDPARRIEHDESVLSRPLDEEPQQFVALAGCQLFSSADAFILDLSLGCVGAGRRYAIAS
jgi:hypothetical protein